MNIDDTSIRIVNGMDGREAGTLRLRDTGTVTCMAFSEDESLLAVGYHNRIVRIWELQKIHQLLEEQRLNWSRALSQSGPITTIRRLDVEASRLLSYPPAFVMVDRPGDSIAIPSAPAVAKAPAVEVNAYEQGVEQATAGQWQAAREQFAVAMNQWSQTAENWHAYALMSLKLGDMAEYQRTCRGMVEQFGSSRDPLQRQWTAWTCALADSSVENWETVSSIADSLVASASDDRSCRHRVAPQERMTCVACCDSGLA